MNIRDNSVMPEDGVAAVAAATPADPQQVDGPMPLDGLLAAVVAACRCMVEHTDLHAGLRAAVTRLGSLSGHDRAYVFELRDGQRFCEITAEWDAPGVGNVCALTGMTRFVLADFAEVWGPLLAGEPYQSVTPVKRGANAALNQAIATRSDLMVPIVVAGVCWGCIGFDNCRTAHHYSDAEVQALRGAASAVAAAVQRSRVEASGREQAARRQQLLTAVNEACTHLVAHADLQTALARALDSLRRHSGVDRVFLHRYVANEQSTYFWCESRRPGIPAFTDGFGPGPWHDDAFPDVALPLRQGRIHRSVATQRAPANRRAHADNGSRSDLIVPILVDGRYTACIGFDDNTLARQWSDSEVVVLQTAAQAVAAALARHAAEAARQQAERARAERAEADAQALRASQALLQTVTQAARRLLAGPDFDASVTETMALLGSTFDVIRAGLVINLTDPVTGGPGGWRVTHEWHAPGMPAQMGTPAAEGSHLRSELVARARAGEAVQFDVQDVLQSSASAHLAPATESTLAVPVFVQGHWWGVVGFDDSRPDRLWAPHEITVLQVAASCIGAALERRQAEDERLRLAHAHRAQAEALNVLTQGVVSATRDLLDHPDFHTGVRAWLAHLGQAAQADAAALIDLGGASPLPAGTVACTALEWRPEGQRLENVPIPSTVDFDAWAQRLQAGQSIWAGIDELADPRSVQYWRDIDCATNLLMPVVLDGAVRFVLCFDWRERRARAPAAEAVLRTAAESFTAVLQRQRAADALLAEREARILNERTRADQAAALVARVEAHARLLEVVARSTEWLLAAPNPDVGITHVLEHIGPVVGAERVCLAQLEWTPDDPQRHGWQHISMEWTRPGAVRQLLTGLAHSPMMRSDRTWTANLAQLQTRGWMRQRVEELDEPYRSAQRTLGVAWSLRYPLVVGGQLTALLSFDCNGDFDDFESATVDALQTVGAAIADALWRHALQQQAITTERRRADGSARLASLLSEVVASSRTLIDADPAGFETAMVGWLGALGRECQAIRATLYDQVDGPTWPSLRKLCEWVREGVTGGVPCSFAQPHTINPQGAEDLIAELTSGRPLVLHTAQTQGSVRDFLTAQGNAMVVAVPVFAAGRPWGAVSFDYAEPREVGDADMAVLQTAADTLSAVLRRNEAAAALLAEREARLSAEHRRNTELARVNDALRQSLDALAGADGEAAFLRDVLVKLQDQTGALAAYLFRTDDADGRLRLVGRAAHGRFSALPASDDPPMFSRGFTLEPSLRDVLQPLTRPLWRRVEAPASEHADLPDSIRWHQAMGHQANAVQALMVGERMVGFIGMVFDRPEPLTEVQLDLAHALSQPLTLALELTRLSRLAQRGGEQAAMLKERNRLAREIHDGIAQSFLAIQMQLDLLSPGAAGVAPVQKAMDLARHGLNEARRAVAALRSQGLHNSDLPSAIQRLLAQAEKAGQAECLLVCPTVWRDLPPDVEDHLFRIVQEAVNNAQRHAQARQIRVELSQAAGEATVLISDDGIGFDLRAAATRQGFGLESMQQRAQLIGARIDWLTEAGRGTQVLLSWTSPPPADGSTPAQPKAAG